MAKGAFNVFELHAEKIVLGVVGAFLLAMVWLYLISTPNKVEFDGKLVGPGELDEAILAQANQLQQRVRGLKPPEVNVPDFSSQLRKQQETGLFAPAEGSPPLAANIRRSAPFGVSINVPGIQADEGKPGGTAIASVTPIKTNPPVVETGRSMVIAVPAAFEQIARPDEKKPEAVEKPWVTIATYFDKQAQQEAMVSAGYPQYRARVLIAGVDVQRQELKADGTWSDWADVSPSAAMPKLTIPSPVLDEATGAVKNRDEIDRVFELVQANQQRIIQPVYFNIDGGDEWVTPPLEGHEPEEEADEDTAKPKEPKPKKELRPQPAPRQTPPPPPTGRGNRGGGGASDVAGGGGGARQNRPPVDDPKIKQEQAKQADADLKEAKEAFKEKEYATARAKAQSAANNEHAKKLTKDQAEDLLKDIESAEEKLAQQNQGGGRNPRNAGGGTVVADGDGAPVNPRGASPVNPRGGGGGVQAVQVAELVTHPTTDAPAVWFHDDSVEAGKTYRYRMRVNVWNRYVGQAKALKNPADAQKTVLTGEWSDAGEPVTTVASSFFFVKGPRAGNEAASVEVWKFMSGSWRRESFDVMVGDVIGGVKKIKTGDDDDSKSKAEVDFATGAVVLDLRFNDRIRVRNAPSKDGSISYRELQSLTLVYYDPADGQVKEKNAIMDKDDPMRKKLEKSSG